MRTYIAASNLLHELGTCSEKHSPEVLALAAGKDRLNGRVSALVARCSDRIADDGDLQSYFGIVSRLPSQTGKYDLGFGVSILAQQPPRAFRTS